MILRSSSLATLLPAALLTHNCYVQAALDLGFESGNGDLTSFVTRPEIKAPRYNVTVHDGSAVSGGYWFVAPYIGLHEPPTPRNVYQTCQTGPHIYDGTGELVWSGACLFKNQVASDLRVFSVGDTDYLSTILYRSKSDPKGHGVILDQSMSITDTVHVPNDIYNMDMHGFQVIEDGRTGLMVNHKTEWMDVSELRVRGLDRDAGFVMNSGFREFDIATNETRFEWWMHDHVPLSHSDVKLKDFDGAFPLGWNPYHVNSVDKDEHGDYLVSSRFTDCIYKVSGRDGSIIWRLGGVQSSFVQEGFHFSRQHDARFIEHNSSTIIISFLDNASDGGDESSSPSSSALHVALETSATPMRARVVQRQIRPDRGLTQMRGNVQRLPNGNTFVCWSENSLISEYTPDGRMLLEAQFASHRSVTYRALKSNWTGTPVEPPVLKIYQYGTSPESSITVCYVSWNGATEVARWRFHRNSTVSDHSTLLGETQRTGFETIFEFEGVETEVYAEGISADGATLGRSDVESPIIPIPLDSSRPKKAQQVKLQGAWPKTFLIRTQPDAAPWFHWDLFVAVLAFGLLGCLAMRLFARKISGLLQVDDNDPRV